MNKQVFTIIGGFIFVVFFSLLGNNAQAADLDCSTASNINVPVGECEAVLDLYDSTNGSGWTNSSGRDTDTDVCTRIGLYCTEIEGQDHINYIGMQNNDISGSLPASLQNLSYLSFLHLDNNAITGELPSERSTLTGMQSFDLRLNNISGELPIERSTRTNITTFNMYDNNISGELPIERSTWINLEDFYIASNNISGELPSEWSTWTSIRELQMSENNISGELPSEWTGFVDIVYFFMSDNNISGELPSERSNRTKMINIDLSDNNISGELPSERSNWINLNGFGASNNNISGELPSERSTWTGLNGFIVSENNISGELPSEWSTRNSLYRFEAIGNNISGELPSEWFVLSDVNIFKINDNQIYGPIPEERISSWGFQNKLDLRNNCLRDHSYTDEEQTWIDTHTIFDPQDNCSQTDVAIQTTTTQTVVDTGSVIDYQITYSNSGFDAFNVTIINNPGTGLSILNASESYTTSSNKEYGVPGDTCYDSLYNNNPGYYLTILDGYIDEMFGLFGISTLEEYVENWHLYAGSDRGAYWINTGSVSEGFESFQAQMIGRGLDMAGDDSCGYVDGPLVYTYTFSLGDVLNGSTGTIFLTGYIADAIGAGQTTIQNTLTIQTDSPETTYENNTAIVANTFSFASVEEDEDEEDVSSGGGGVTLDPDDCPDGDFSGSYYDGICEAQEDEEDEIVVEEPTEDTEPVTDAGSNHASAPVSYNACDAYNEKASPHTFTDIKNTSYKGAIELLIDNCLVHGYYNQGIEYGTNDGIKRGEVYKVFARLSGLPKQEVADPVHWSDKYFQAGDKAGLWTNIDTSNSAESPITRKELLEVTINYMKLQGYDIEIPEGYAINEGSITRGEFASFVEQIIAYNTSQQNQPEQNDADQETTKAKTIDEEVSPNNKNTSPRSGDSLQNTTSYLQDGNLGGLFGETYDANPRHSFHNSIS